MLLLYFCLCQENKAWQLANASDREAHMEVKRSHLLISHVQTNAKKWTLLLYPD
jgi:hypothetical protein